MSVRKSKSKTSSTSELNKSIEFGENSKEVKPNKQFKRLKDDTVQPRTVDIHAIQNGNFDLTDDSINVNTAIHDESKSTIESMEETNFTKFRSSRNRPVINYAEEEENYIESTDLIDKLDPVLVESFSSQEKLNIETGITPKKNKVIKNKKSHKNEEEDIEQSNESVFTSAKSNDHPVGSVESSVTLPPEIEQKIETLDLYNAAQGEETATTEYSFGENGSKIVEPPIKIIINKHKTRRKSKSFKKVDHKGPNDLFEDFALVIKKPKGTAPIITFTPADTFSKASDSNDMTNHIDIIPQDILPSFESDSIHANDESVEEMDMELDEIPITSNIIERSDQSISLTLTKSEENVGSFIDPTSKTLTKPTKQTKSKKRVRKSVKKASSKLSKKVSSAQNSIIENIELEQLDGVITDMTIVNDNKSDSNINDNIEEMDEKILSNIHGSSISLLSDIYNDRIQKACFTEPIDGSLSTEDSEAFAELDKNVTSETGRSGADNLPTNDDPSANEMKLKDIDKIYTFSDTEDIVEPLEIPKRLPRGKTKSFSEIDKVEEDPNSIIISKSPDLDEDSSLLIMMRKTRNGNACTENEEEMKDVVESSSEDVLENLLLSKLKSNRSKETKSKSAIELNSSCSNDIVGKITCDEDKIEVADAETYNVDHPNEASIINKKPVRTAKVKALEHIHDDALADLNTNNKRSSRKLVSTGENKNKDPTKRNKKSKKNINSPSILEVLDEKSPLLVDLVADLAGLEELENSIERELNAEKDFCHESPELQDELCNIKGSNEDILKTTNMYDYSQDNQELRRSRRPRKNPSYNENDVDPVNNDKTTVTFKNNVGNVQIEKNNTSQKKLNTDELFDLLKASTSSAPLYPAKPTNSFLTSLDGSLKDNNDNDDNLDNIFDNILEKSSLIVQDNIKRKNDLKDMEKVFDFLDDSDLLKENVVGMPTAMQLKDTSAIYISSENSSVSSLSVTQNSSNAEIKQKAKKLNTKESNYCEICNKSFIRLENLIKHKKTLTHIQKLSEIEIKCNEEASKKQLDTNVCSKLEQIECSKADINISSILNSSEKPSNNISPVVLHSSFSNNDSLKLADIISDVLNKPVLDQDHSEEKINSRHICQDVTEVQLDQRRCKSLGERKSFDSDKIENLSAMPGTFMSKTTILEKQICLLENIIENQTSNYIDDISMSSNSSERQSNSGLSIKHSNITKPTSTDDSFLKPTQYEEISEDSANLRNYEDQKLRKTLNRDEELFLECCSLLKSGSEVSSYSNKKSQTKNVNATATESIQGPEWSDQKNCTEKAAFDITDDYCDDNSRIPTPLGDSFDDGASDSNTISSNWGTSGKENVNQAEVFNTTFNLDEVLNNDIAGDNMASGKRSNCKSASNTVPQNELDNSIGKDIKKIITKGARKVFEGLKVSIPTEDLNMEEVLNSSPKKNEFEAPVSSPSSSVLDKQIEVLSGNLLKPSRSARKSKPVKKSQVGSNLLFKVKKKKMPPTGKNKVDDSEVVGEKVNSYDVYDFEETQDNSDIFTKPDFRAFRNMKGNDFIEPESDIESRDYLDPCSVERESITSTSVSSTLSSVKRPKAEENITKKKCMIMGRIFKNAAKSKLEDIDEEIRSIPNIDNDALVENYVANCKRVIKNEAKPKLSEKEINQLFDQLLERKNSDDENNVTTKSTKSKTDSKKAIDVKKKVKSKNRKRVRTNSDSTDDEFKLNNTSKRVNRKNAKAEDNCINLEQELKECIGVASRKSQRKCTSGKQNVLVEYWSSDESQFEALLESQRIETIQTNEVTETLEEKVVVPQPYKDRKEENKQPEPPPKIKNPSIKHNPKQKKTMHKKKPTANKKEKFGIEPTKIQDTISNRRKRAAVNPLYHWSSSSEDEMQDLIEVKPIRDEMEDDEDRPIQHGWIVGDSPKKLVTMLAQAKGKKTDIDGVKEQGKRRTNAVS